jgi:hypothetical protein
LQWKEFFTLYPVGNLTENSFDNSMMKVETFHNSLDSMRQFFSALQHCPGHKHMTFQYQNPAQLSKTTENMKEGKLILT